MANPTITLVGRLGQDPAPIGDNGLRLRLVTNDRKKMKRLASTKTPLHLGGP